MMLMVRSLDHSVAFHDFGLNTDLVVWFLVCSVDESLRLRWHRDHRLRNLSCFLRGRRMGCPSSSWVDRSGLPPIVGLSQRDASVPFTTSIRHSFSKLYANLTPSLIAPFFRHPVFVPLFLGLYSPISMDMRTPRLFSNSPIPFCFSVTFLSASFTLAPTIQVGHSCNSACVSQSVIAVL